MDTAAFILALLSCLPGREVKGRKRLQKLAFFAVNKGAPVDLKFILHDFGPYCPAIANATQTLTFFGDLEEADEQIGRAKHTVKTYKLSALDDALETLNPAIEHALRTLSGYTTIELEVASTLLYFYESTRSWDHSILETKALKPTKTEPSIIDRAFDALNKVDLYEGRRAN